LERTMSSEGIETLLSFVRRFLEGQGALVEQRTAGLDALLPPPLAQRLEVPEYVTFREDQPAKGEGHYRVNYGAPLLEKMVDLCCNSLPMASSQVSFPYIKSQGFDRSIREQFTLRNSLCRVTSTALIKTHYLLLACRYVARSDEQKEGLIVLFLHFDTGAFLSYPPNGSFMAAAEPAFLPETARDISRWEKLLKRISTEAEGLIAGEIRDFRDSMNRRLKRDTGNLEEYYGTLKKEMESSLTRAGLSDRLIRDRKEKIALLPEELARKREDLVMKYSIRVKMIPCAALLIRTPAVRILCDLHVERQKKPVSLTYNPITKALDPLICEGCGRSVAMVSFCSSKHLLCSCCEEKCPLCGCQ
jgi:hypothetical protein